MVKTIAAALAGLFLIGGSAIAAKAPAKTAAPPAEPPMRVVLVRNGAPGCQPSCAEWIAAQGKIEARTIARFRKIIDQLGPRRLPILIHSGGGDMDASLAIGRLLRARGYDIAVARTAFVPCAPKDAACAKNRAKDVMEGRVDDSLSICASACAFVLAAGNRRVVPPRAFVGVHQILLLQTYSKVLQTYKLTLVPSPAGPRVRRQLVGTKVIAQKVVPRKAPASVYTRAEKYFAEMGVDDRIMPLLQQTPNASVHWLTDDELQETKIATHRLSGDQLLAGVALPGNGWTAPAADRFSASAEAPRTCERFGGVPIGCSTEIATSANTEPVIVPPLPARRSAR